MKKSFVRIVCCIVLFCCTLTGCSFSSEPSEPKNNLTVIAARQANQPAPDVTLIKEDLFQTARSFGQVHMIRLDGAPVLEDTFSITPKDGFYTKAQLDSRASNQAAQIQSAIESIIAQEPETDLLGALCLAGRCVEQKEGETNTLLVFSNGLSTCPPLDMTVTVLHNLDAEQIIKSLDEQQAVPDLSKYAAVKIYQFGETESPQDPLTQKDKVALQQLWTSILIASGLDESCITFVDTPPTDDNNDFAELPPISTVTVIQDENAIASSGKSGINITLPESSVSFVPDTDRLTNPDTTRTALQPTADTLLKYPDIQVLIIGQTATAGDIDSCRELSLRRAQRVSQALKNLGVKDEQIQCIGLGYEPSPLHVEDLAADGSLLEDQAKKNRVVHIIDASTPLAQEILSKHTA